ncbi:hypothetical protein LEMLEM_LOCUS20130 [Lemmus lemmus]
MATQDHIQRFRGISSERKHLSPDAVMFLPLELIHILEMKGCLRGVWARLVAICCSQLRI